MKILLAESEDDGRTWTSWREVPVPADVGPPSLTSPIRRLPSGRLLLSIESNKDYWSRDDWFQRVVFLYSADEGRTWTEPVTVIGDPTGRIRNWDLRIAPAAPPDTRLVSFGWTYDAETVSYLNVQRRLSADEGLDLDRARGPRLRGPAGAPGHPRGRARGPGLGRPVRDPLDPRPRGGQRGRGVRPGVRGRPVPAAGGRPAPAGTEGDGGEALVAMQTWTFGLPFALARPDGKVLVARYLGDSDAAIGINWYLLDPDA